MNITPLFDRILIAEEKQETATQTGFLLSNNNSENVITAKVLATGNGNEKDNGTKSEMIVKTNDRILCSKYAITTFKIKDKEVGIVRQSDVLAILR